MSSLLLAVSLSQKTALLETTTKSAETFRRLMDSNIVGVVIADIHGGLSYANDVFLSQLGYTREEFDTAKIRWTSLTPSEHLHLDEIAIQQLRSTGSFSPFEKEYFHKNGTRMPILLGGTYIDSTQTDVVAFVLA